MKESGGRGSGRLGPPRRAGLCRPTRGAASLEAGHEQEDNTGDVQPTASPHPFPTSLQGIFHAGPFGVNRRCW